MVVVYRNKINEAKKIYQYVDKNDKIITDKKILDYIAALPPIPPAYNDVEIFVEKNPKIIFQGRDIKGKLQQIYSAKYRSDADKGKFKALTEFGYKLPQINTQIEKNMRSSTLTKGKIISLILLLIQDCGFRIGSLNYFNLNKSIGLSTLMRKHVTIKPKNITIKFLGKKGVPNNCNITDPIIIREITKIARDKKPNDFMFSYIDTDTKEEMLVSGEDINDWLKMFGEEFTTKMFRTFATNVLFIELMHDTKPGTLTESQRKKKTKEILEILACSINNSPTICKKSYLSPELLKLYIEHGRKYENDINKSSDDSTKRFITFLEKYHF